MLTPLVLVPIQKTINDLNIIVAPNHIPTGDSPLGTL